MQRRNFLRWGVAGAAASGAAGSGACAPSGQVLDPERAARRAQRPPLSDHEFDQRLAALDRGMGHIQSARLGWAPATRTGEEHVDAQLFRSSMRSLLVTSSINDLPEADRTRPQIKQRVDSVAPEIDFAVSGSLERVGQISRHELADIQAALKDDPELTKKIAEAIDEEALAGGVPLRRRLHFRRMVGHTLWRMKKQSVGLVIEETVAKVQRMAERYLKSDHLRPIVEPRPADIARWDAQTRRVAALYQDPTTAATTAATTIQDPAAQAMPPVPIVTVAAHQAMIDAKIAEERRQQREQSGRNLMIAGGATMGASVAVALLGVGLFFGGLNFIAGAISWTVAGILLIVGVILMIVGGVRHTRAREAAPAGT